MASGREAGFGMFNVDRGLDRESECPVCEKDIVGHGVGPFLHLVHQVEGFEGMLSSDCDQFASNSVVGASVEIQPDSTCLANGGMKPEWQGDTLFSAA